MTDLANSKTFYISTAISYPNGTPHIGHAYEFVATDAMARFKRLDGYDVFFLTGTDEHGQKMMQTALNQDVRPQELARVNSDRFQATQDALGISYDRFIRTTDADHQTAAQAIWKAMEAKGDIYLGHYAGWYSVRDEAYYDEDETHVGEDGVRYATETETEVTWTEEESYFFRLSKYAQPLLDFYQANPEFAAPQSRFNEVIRFVERGLDDLSISRTTFDWGVPVPGSPGHVMYVWVDALTNYLTGVGYPETDSEAFRKFWPADVHVIGKDISRFHAIYWPAFLMSAGLQMPKRIMIHGFLHNNGVKMSKSLGNTVSPEDFVDAYSLDAMRYFFLREVPFGADGSYSHEAIVSRMNAELANNLGNLAQRSLSMVAKNLDGCMPALENLTEQDQALLDAASGLLETARNHYDKQAFSLALAEQWKVLHDANAYFAEMAPWVLRKEDPERMAVVLAVTLDVVRRVALLAQPVMPDSLTLMLDALGVPTGASRTFAAYNASVPAGTELPKPKPIFPRYEPPKED